MSVVGSTRMVTSLLLGVFCLELTISLPSSKVPDGQQTSSDALGVVHVYHGLIKEDALEGDEVELDVPLRVKEKNALKGDICGYTVFSNGTDRLPFRIILLDPSTGSAKIVLASGFQLDHEQTREYNFNIAAHDCSSGSHSEKERVHVEVEDVNEFDPVWVQRVYYAEASDGQLFSRLVHLQAIDRDGDGMGDGGESSSGKICHYDITTEDVPFEVDADGYVRNTEPLDFSHRRSYVLQVVAEDCGHRRSMDAAIVNIEVKSVCRPEWTGIPDRLEFTPREDRKAIVPSARLQLCSDACNVTRVAVTMTLSTDHIGKGCDRDTYSIQSQRRLCGAVDGTVDLLPSPSRRGSFTKDLPTDDGHESDQIFAFDGATTAIEVPADKVDADLGWHFTISTWMKHEEKDKDGQTKKTKEHILCHSDGEDMNRHHYSVFVHNCRLVLLLRLEPDSGVDRNAYRPAEWRWTTVEVCDGKWHHYALSVEFPLVRLYVDGKQFVTGKHNPEIVDDWPLHQSKHVHFTKLTIGACWHGGEHHMVQYFHGYLAGLSLLKNRTETDQVIQCLTNCQERLDFAAVDQMETGMSVSMNNEVTNITITGSTESSVERLLQRISYVNTRTYPTTGHRPITLDTRVTCDDGHQLVIERVKSLLMVLEADKPIIALDAQKSVETEAEKLMEGEKIFHDLHIAAHTKADETEPGQAEVKEPGSEDSKDRFQLDSCVIRVDPPLTLAIEHLRYPDEVIRQLAMEVDSSEDGLVIAGADKLSHYEEILDGILYVNSRPEELNSRTFVLSCTELNGRFISNQLSVILEVVHVNEEATVAAQAIANDKMIQHQLINGIHTNDNKRGSSSVAKSHDEKKKSNSETVTGIIVVCIVCIGFVSLLVVLGVMRIRNAKRHSQRSEGVNVDEKQEMEWDNSALTITVNPMDQEAATLFEDESHVTGLRGDETDSDDDASFHDDNEEAESTEEEEEEVEKTTAKAKSRELEWDDSTLSF